MNLFDQFDYRGALRARLKTVRTQGKSMTWRTIAEKIPVQYTFLSKCLNDDKAHLNEDHLFRVCELLEFLPTETEFLLLLRARDLSRETSRIEFLTRQIEKLRKQNVVRAEHKQADNALNFEMDYLLDPLATLVRVSLFVKEIRAAPMRLTTLLGISPARLKTTLEKLSKIGFVELNTRGDKVLSIHTQPLHWSRQHPLMRTWLMNLKHQMLERLRSAEEQDKESFFVTFNMDERGFNEVKLLIQDTLKTIQRISEKSDQRHVYQFSVDLLRVL